MLTLWDLIDPILEKFAKPAPKGEKEAGRRRERGDAQTDTGLQERSVPGRIDRQTHGGSADGHAVIASPATNGVCGKRAKGGKSGESDAATDSMQARYDAVVELMLRKYQIRVRKWRSGMSGVAWYVIYRDGRRVNLIESPKPKGPMSVAVFLHEIGHHAIGFNVYKPRCLEEYHAWRWSLEAMQEHGLNITDQVRYRMHMSLWYAVSKAKRRGIKNIPDELRPFMERAVKPKTERRKHAA